VLEEDGETGSVSQENEATGVGDLAGLSLSSIVVVGDVLASSARDGGGARFGMHRFSRIGLFLDTPYSRFSSYDIASSREGI